MRKIHLLGLVLLATAATSAVIAASGYAEEWLLNTGAILAPVASHSEGDLLLSETVNKFDIKCKVIKADTHETVGARKKDEATATEFLECNELSTVCAAVTVTPVGIGGGEAWLTEVKEEGATFLDLLQASKVGSFVPGWHVDCVLAGTGLLVEVSCQAKLPANNTEDYTTTLKNVGNGTVNDEFKGAEKMKCTNGGEGETIGTLNISSESGALAIS